MCIIVLFERKFGELCDVLLLLPIINCIKSNGMRLSSEIVAIFDWFTITT